MDADAELIYFVDSLVNDLSVCEYCAICFLTRCVYLCIILFFFLRLNRYVYIALLLYVSAAQRARMRQTTIGTDSCVRLADTFAHPTYTWCLCSFVYRTYSHRMFNTHLI